MNALRINANCLASSQPLEAGRVYQVPADVSREDAEALVRMGRASEVAQETEQKPKRTRKRADA